MRTAKSFITLALLAISLAACDKAIYDYDRCKEGIELKFVFDYNMESADAFPSKVDCLTVLLYDEHGKHVRTLTERTEVLKDPSYRMAIDLPEGRYHVAAYGGMECEDASFVFDSDPSSLTKEARTVSLATAQSSPSGPVSAALLHDHYFGSADITVEEADFEYTTATVEMMRNTNHFRVILQQAGGKPLQASDFDMAISDDNTHFAHDNSLLPTAEGITYKQWSQGERSVGANLNDEEQTVAYYELSTSRLITRESRSAATPSGASSVSDPRLNIRSTADNSTIADIPLLKYLLLMKSDRYQQMSDQEFLDRCSDWNVVLFLDDNLQWINTYIVVNDWVVRINSAEL